MRVLSSYQHKLIFRKGERMKEIKLPSWTCETHMREIEDLQDSGEFSESKVRASEIVNEYLWCEDCKSLRAEWALGRTREWAIAHTLGMVK